MVTIMKDYVSWRAQALITKKPVKRGDVLLTSRPFCTLLDSNRVGSYCEHCLCSSRKDRVLTRCADCGRAWYCSHRCQELGQQLHRRECIVFHKKPDYQPKDFARFLARLIWRLRSPSPPSADTREIRRDPEQMKYLDSLMPDLNVLVGSRYMPSRDFLLIIYGKVLVNSFCLLDDRLTPIGMSLYLAASIIDHACTANAFVSFLGNKLVVRSLVNWPDLDWDRVHISYLDVMNTRKERQEFLRRHYYFTCDCRLCRDDEQDLLTSTIACGFPTCGAPIYIDETADGGIDPCEACGFKNHPDDLRQDYRYIAKLTKQKLAQLDEQDPDLEVWRDLVEAQEDILHPLNVLKAKSLDALMTATLNMRGWHSAWGLARRNHNAIRHYYGPKHPTYGLFLMKLGKIELNNMASSLALEHLKEAEEILEAGLGSNHPLVYLELAWLMIQASEETKVEIQRSLIYGERHTPPYIHALSATNTPSPITNAHTHVSGASVQVSNRTHVNASTSTPAPANIHTPDSTRTNANTCTHTHNSTRISIPVPDNTHTPDSTRTSTPTTANTHAHNSIHTSTPSPANTHTHHPTRTSTAASTSSPARSSPRSYVRSNASALTRPVHAHVHVYAHVPVPARAHAVVQEQHHLHVPVLAQANVREHARIRNHVQDSVRSLPHSPVHAISRGRS